MEKFVEIVNVVPSVRRRRLAHKVNCASKVLAWPGVEPAATVLRPSRASTGNARIRAARETLAEETPFVRFQTTVRSVYVPTATKASRVAAALLTNAEVTRIAKLIRNAVQVGLAKILAWNETLAVLTPNAKSCIKSHSAPVLRDILEMLKSNASKAPAKAA